MLSDISIQKFLTSGDIIIDPWDVSALGSCRVVAHLGRRLLLPQSKEVVDVRLEPQLEYKEVAITESDPFRLEPGMFVLGETWEKIGLSEKISALIEGRSTLARLGIQVVQTAMLIDSGQKPKRMTLEIFNAGPQPVLLYPRMKFCRLFFFELDQAAARRYDTNGRYQDHGNNQPILTDSF